MFSVTRDLNNPLIQSDNNTPWRNQASFNGSPAFYNGDEYMVYRAFTDPTYYNGHTMELSTVGVARKDKNGAFVDHHQLISPTEDWEKFGCEDPRVTEVDGVYYIFYTALSDYPFSAENIKVAVAISDDLKTIREKHLVTPFNAKAMALFPKRIKDKWTVILTANSDLPPSKMAIAQFDSIEDIWENQTGWQEWYKMVDRYSLDLRRVDTDHAEVGAVPIRTDAGWLIIYSHIQNYFSDQKIFGIEAVLMTPDDPYTIIGQTHYPFMVPEESYELYGMIGDIVFPSGATVEDDTLRVYYGAADTSVCAAELSLGALLSSMQSSRPDPIHRYNKNPILEPIKEHDWEAAWVLNPTAIDIDNEVQILYRSISPDSTSYVGLATSKDGYTIDDRLPEPIYWPRADFETKKGDPNGNSGCEDARVMQIEDRLYITYTGYNGVDLPGVAASSISVSDFKKHDWSKWTTPYLISPNNIDDKDAAIFTEKINGKYMVLHRIDHHVCADFVDTLDFSKENLVRCIQMLGPRRGMWDSKKVGINGPPIKTDKGWLLFYHGINEKHFYCMGAVLLDLDDPTMVIGRTAMPLMEPREPWELEGWINNVVFSCGQVVRGDDILIYYGGADSVVAVGTISLSRLVNGLTPVV
jgi:predicted GH43/DUF377 family glycosyl hydrolase